MFLIGSIEAHPDFTSALWTMGVLSPGTDDISILFGSSTPSIPNQAVSSYSYTNQTVAYKYEILFKTNLAFIKSLYVSIIVKNYK